MAQTAAHLVDRVIPHVPVRQGLFIQVVRPSMPMLMLMLMPTLMPMPMPIPLNLLRTAQHKLVTPTQQVHRQITRHLLGQAGHKPGQANSGAVTLIQRVGSAANLNMHLHDGVLNNVCQRSAAGTVAFV